MQTFPPGKAIIHKICKCSVTKSQMEWLGLKYVGVKSVIDGLLAVLFCHCAVSYDQPDLPHSVGGGGSTSEPAKNDLLSDR